MPRGSIIFIHVGEWTPASITHNVLEDGGASPTMSNYGEDNDLDMSDPFPALDSAMDTGLELDTLDMEVMHSADRELFTSPIPSSKSHTCMPQ